MLWTTPANWSTPIIERLEWRTDVLLAYNGSEQRIALRQTPRRYFEFGFLVPTLLERQKLEAAISANGSQSWDLPIWTDSTPCTSAVSNGDVVVYADTVGRDFVAGGKALLLATNGNTLIINISTFTATQLNLSSAVVGAWPIETAVIPLRTAYLEQNQQISRFTASAIYGVVRFLCDDISEWPTTTETEYRDYPVLTTPSNWSQDLTLDYQRKMQIVDFGVGGIYRDDESSLPVFVQSHHFVLDSRQKITDFRKFLYSRRGRLNALWIPTFMPDLSFVALSSTALDITNIGYTTLYNQTINRRDIRIELTNGNVYYRRIVASTVISGTVERLTLDSVLGVSVTAADVEKISFMMFGRLDTDAIELAWSYGDYVDVRLNFRSINNDV
ncbi:MAG: hypothetical protein KAY00_00050 [Agitococcus sp.]|nr:hypothetical protein [Agitococcus sp.]